MKLLFSLIILFSISESFCQVLPNVSIDSLSAKLYPIYRDALKNGIYDSPRDTCWKNLTSYETEAIKMQTPASWLKLGGLGTVVDMAFDGTGLYFPDTFNNKPIMVGAFILNQPGASLIEAKDLALKAYRLNADRSFEADYQDAVNNYDLPNGKKGYLLHTRFFRRSNQLNQSRYDLILYSEKLKKAFAVLLSIQYCDTTYNFEQTYLLNEFAARLFSHVVLK